MVIGAYSQQFLSSGLTIWLQMRILNNPCHLTSDNEADLMVVV